MKNLKIALFHYHFLPGGVTTVAVHAVNALLEFSSASGYRIDEIVFISGRQDNLDNIINRQITVPSELKTVIKTEVCPAIDYLTDENGKSVDIYEKEIKTLLGKYKNYFWWIHNYHIGKNPLFTRAVTETLENWRAQMALLHIHDFPECARPDNYRFLTGRIFKIYPDSPNIRYAAINARDERYLKESGLPGDRVFLLYDPVPGLKKNDFMGIEQNPAARSGGTGRTLLSKEVNESHASGKGTSALSLAGKKKIFSGFSAFFPAYNPEKPFALYPVRTIRRKNILEAAVLSHITGNGFNLIVTLPGISRQERKYSAMVRECYEKGYIPGIWGCGSNEYGPPASFSAVVDLSDFIISTSVIEGFGYLFIDSLRWGKPLVAKYLDIMEGFSDIFRNTASYFYSCVTVPARKNETDEIRKIYLSNIKNYAGIIEKSGIDSLTGQIDSIISRSSVDYSYLPVEKQVEILSKLSRDRGYRNEVASLNSEVTSGIRAVMDRKQYFDTSRASAYFSYQSFSHNFFSVVTSLREEASLLDKSGKPENHRLPHAGEKADPAGRTAESANSNNNGRCQVSDNLLNLFFRPEYMRLILTE